MKGALNFLQTVIKVRKKLITLNMSKKNTLQMIHYMEPIDKWLCFWSNKATDEGALIIIAEHQWAISEIIPNSKSGCGPRLQAQLKEFINHKTHKDESVKNIRAEHTERSLQLPLPGGRCEPENFAEGHYPANRQNRHYGNCAARHY